MKLRFFFVALLWTLARRASCQREGRLSQTLLGSIGSVATGATDFISTAGLKSRNLLVNATRATTGIVDSAASKGLELKLRGVLEKFRERMKYGFPEFNLPPLEPFVIDEFELEVENPEIGNISLYVWDAEIHKLSTFIVDRAKLSLIGPTVTLNISVPEVYATGEYNITGVIGNTFPIIGGGSFKVSVYDVQVYTTSSYGFNRGMFMKTFDLDFQFGAIKANLDNFMGGEKIGEIMNKVFEEIAPEVIETVKPDFMPQIKEAIASRANDTLKHMTMKDIISLLIGDTEGNILRSLTQSRIILPI